MKRFLGSPRKVTQSHMFSSPGSRFCSASAMAMPAISVDSMVSQGSVRLASVRLVGRRREGTPSNAERRLPAGPPEPTPSRPGPRPPRRGSKTSPAPGPARPAPAVPGTRPLGLWPVLFPYDALSPAFLSTGQRRGQTFAKAFPRGPTWPLLPARGLPA